MGGVIGWIPPHGFPQPPHGGRPVTIQPVGIAKIEERIDPFEAGGLVEVRHGTRPLVILPSPQLQDTQVVEERGVALHFIQARQFVERLLIALQFEQRDRRQETRLPGKPVVARHLRDGSQSALVLAEIIVNVPRRDACSLQIRGESKRFGQKRQLRRRRLRQQALDELLERRDRGMTVLQLRGRGRGAWNERRASRL